VIGCWLFQRRKHTVHSESVESVWCTPLSVLNWYLLAGHFNIIPLVSGFASIWLHSRRSYSVHRRYCIRSACSQCNLPLPSALCRTWYFLPLSSWLLDHTRYFSQMIISFRRMAIDLLASLLFIVVFFTGFFVAFSVTFGNSIWRQLLTSSEGPLFNTDGSVQFLGKARSAFSF